MKIIFITRESFDLPAARVRCYGFANALSKHGIDTEVFSYADQLGAKSGKQERFMCVREKIFYNFQAFKYLYSQNAVFFVQRFNYHSFAPLFLKFFKNRKLIFDLDDWEARENNKYYFNKISSSKAEIGMRLMAKSSKFCIGASTFLVDFLSKDNNNVLYIPTAVNTNLFKPGKNHQYNDRIIISWIGTMHRPDNIENLNFLISCFQQISLDFSNIQLEIMGDGIYYNRVKILVEQANNTKIKLLPWIAHTKVADYLENIDIGVMPLIQQTKFNLAKSPTRIFEYMSMAKPVLCSKLGEAVNIICDGENGFLAQGKTEFTAKLKELIRYRQLRDSLGQNARRTIESKYSLKKVTALIAEQIKKI